MTSWAQGNGSTARSATFEYDGAGARTHMQYTNAGNTAANTDTRYLQDATGMAEALQELNGSTRNSYLYAPGSTSPFAYDEAGTAYWYHHDGLGSIRVTTTATGTVQTVQSYSAFGSREIAFNNGVNSNPALDKGTHGFAGEQSDPTGLSYNRARYYDPTLGRFLQRDSVIGDPSNPLSMNLFVYTQNNPANAIDPSGNIVDRPQMPANDGGASVDQYKPRNVHRMVRNLASNRISFTACLLVAASHIRIALLLPHDAIYSGSGDNTRSVIDHTQLSMNVPFGGR